MQSWNDITRAMVAEHPELPKAIKDPAKQLVERSMGVVSQIVGNLELVYRRGHQEGYEDGYADAAAGNPNRFDR